ncbi:hypothetical protein [Streptococcus oralis]|uniref:hypothetical protein n=1 Tax=Streptococcus oralis TaxID=1303 RepID=UPI002284A1D5|nr:hypothetical protein [Streptococcus oralis]MCY7081272.1 hypothetical protein [Streptococcus oralis]
MDKEQWIEIFKEINDRVPTEEEIQAGVQSGEITESEKIDNSFESTQFDSQTRSNEDLSQRVEDVQDKQEFSNDYTFCSSCGTKNSVSDERCMHCEKVLKQTNENVFYSTLKNNSLFKYLKYCYDTQRWGILIYFSLAMFIQNYTSIFAILFTVFLLSKKGQSLICWIAGAKKIERTDYKEIVQQPINEIIKKARQMGLNLPEDIEIRIIHNQIPGAYAIGMNTIIVTDSLMENPYYLEPKIIFELHRIHNMAPNLLPVVVGSNFLLIFVLLILLVTTLFGGFRKNYGDSRNSFWIGSSEVKEGAIIFYGSILLIMTLISFFYMFVKSIVKRDVLLSDQYMASIGLGEAHCLYLDTLSEIDDSIAKRICSLGYPNKDKRISILQENYNVRYTGV